MKKTRRFLCAALVLTSASALDVRDDHSAEEGGSIDGELALSAIQKGNERFATGHLEHARQDKRRVEEVAKVQKPYAIVVGCADSRVPPELVFDQGLGDLFVVRVAGNVVDDSALGSIEYAVEHLGSRLIVVLGHERCGAVKAALDGGEAPGHIGALIEAIAPAIEAVRDKPGDALDNAVRANIRRIVKELATAGPLLSALVEKGELAVVGARYDLDTGEVDLHP